MYNNEVASGKNMRSVPVGQKLFGQFFELVEDAVI